ncbi:MAG: hypothetical protein R3C68_18725 [Myxococcota bacterium]
MDALKASLGVSGDAAAAPAKSVKAGTKKAAKSAARKRAKG